MKGYSVFNVEQIEGLPEHYCLKPEPVIDPALRIERVEEFFGNAGAGIRHGGRLCCTNPVRDSSCESSVVAGAHEQTHPPDLQDQELAGL